jgi:hypothetical protein
MLGAGVALGTVMSAYRYTNGLSGHAISEDDEDEVERKETMRKLRRRPLLETVEQLGEGRGLFLRPINSLAWALTRPRYIRSGLRRAET